MPKVRSGARVGAGGSATAAGEPQAAAAGVDAAPLSGPLTFPRLLLAASAPLLACCPAGNVSVRFRMPYHCKYGQKLCLIGESDMLGGWAVERALAMNWTEGDVWEVELQLPAK